MSEAIVQTDIMLAASEDGNRLLRNNVGAYKDKRGVWVKYGVGGKGGSDLIGWTQVIITADMVGQTLPVFTAVEVKENAKPTTDQLNFIGSVKRAGGIAGIAHSVEEYRGLSSDK
jgi:hypothetical protein